MAEVKLTKNQLRDEQKKLGRLKKYLPTLQLKKAMLQLEVQNVREEIRILEKALAVSLDKAEKNAAVLVTPTGLDFQEATKVQKVHKHYENIAGVEVPFYEGVDFYPLAYGLFDTPPWLEAMVALIREACEGKVKLDLAKEKKRAIEKELREVSIRVNLFEKVLIPRTFKNIRKIKVFLDDQQLAAVSQAKVAKKKIEGNHAD